jgi:hypothetical protein
VDQAAELFTYSFDNLGGAMSKKITPPTGKKVKVAIPFGIPNVSSLASHEGDGVSRVVRDNVSIKEGEGFLKTERHDDRTSDFRKIKP